MFYIFRVRDRPVGIRMVKWQPDGVVFLIILNIVLVIYFFNMSYKGLDELQVNSERFNVSFLVTELKQLNSKVESLKQDLNKTNVFKRNALCQEKRRIIKRNNRIDTESTWDLNVADELDLLMENQTVAEFEAGLGCYGRYFLRGKTMSKNLNSVDDVCSFDKDDTRKINYYPQRVTSWNGFDSFIFASAATAGLVTYLDLNVPIYLKRMFHWVISLRLDNPLLDIYEQIFISNVARHACKGIILAWSFPPGRNISVNDYINEQMAKHGFVYEHSWTHRFQSRASSPSLKTHLLAYRREKPFKDIYCHDRAINDLKVINPIVSSQLLVASQ